MYNCTTKYGLGSLWDSSGRATSAVSAAFSDCNEGPHAVGNHRTTHPPTSDASATHPPTSDASDAPLARALSGPPSCLAPTLPTRRCLGL
ncbi:hypothetical protein T484DRAFT_1829211 [Baffinella frigidus]|nr:hypothetical protein T484DRAFT_1829211 [Cryptophyta sp. CCMP2293]